MPQPEADYRALLVKYIRHVGDCDGVNHIEDRSQEDSDVPWAPGEWEALEAAAEAARADQAAADEAWRKAHPPRPLVAGHHLVQRDIPPATYTVTINDPGAIEAIVRAFETGQRVVVTVSGAFWDPIPPVAGTCAVVSCEVTRPGEITAVLEGSDGRRVIVIGRRADGAALAPISAPEATPDA